MLMKKEFLGANENCWAICAEGDFFFFPQLFQFYLKDLYYYEYSLARCKPTAYTDINRGYKGFSASSLRCVFPSFIKS